MKKTVLGYITIAAMLICSALPVFSDSAISYSKTVTEAGMKITGQITSAPGGEEVLLRVLKHTEGVIDLNTDLIYMEQQKTDDTGKFSFSFEIPDSDSSQAVNTNTYTTEKYTISLGTLKSGKKVSEVVEYYGTSYRNHVKNAINTSKQNNDETELGNILSDEYDRLLIDAAVYDEYMGSGGTFSRLAAMLIAAPQINNLEEFAHQLNQSAAIQMLIDIDVKDTNSIVNFISSNKYQESLDISNSSALNLFEKLNKNCQNAIGVKYKTLIENGSQPSQKAFELSTISVGLENAVAYEDVAKILKENEAILGIDFSRYALTATELLSLAGVQISQLTDVKGLLDAIVKKRTNYSKQPDGGGGGGGSRSSISSGSLGGSGGFLAGENNHTDLSNSSLNVINPFTDLKNHEWAEESIVNLYKKKIINGRTQNTFEPEATVTREEFLKMLISAAGVKIHPADDNPFSDAKKDEWYYPYISTAYKAGIVNGDESGNFGIGEPIKREDIAVIIRRLYFPENSVEKNNESPYLDNDLISDYAKDSIELMRTTGIMKGSDNNCFMPQANATRAEAAVLINRILEIPLNGGN